MILVDWRDIGHESPTITKRAAITGLEAKL
jgi:hypothetical protein